MDQDPPGPSPHEPQSSPDESSDGDAVLDAAGCDQADGTSDTPDAVGGDAVLDAAGCDQADGASDTPDASRNLPRRSRFRLQPDDRRRLARAVIVIALFAILVMVLRSWQGQAHDITLVHRFTGADALLPASVQVMVWQDETLHADAYFPGPEDLSELEHSVRLPAGRYHVTVTIARTFGQEILRFERELEVTEAGRYYLSYEGGAPSTDAETSP